MSDSDPSNRARKGSLTLKDLILPVIYGFRKKCPVCKKASIFGTGKKYWTMVSYCPNCGVKFVRETGEYIVAMYINVFATEIIFISGYFLLDYYYDLAVLTQLLVWVPFSFFFPVWFYPRSKGMWAGVLSLMGGLYRD